MTKLFEGGELDWRRVKDNYFYNSDSHPNFAYSRGKLYVSDINRQSTEDCLPEEAERIVKVFDLKSPSEKWEYRDNSDGRYIGDPPYKYWGCELSHDLYISYAPEQEIIYFFQDGQDAGYPCGSSEKAEEIRIAIEELESE